MSIKMTLTSGLAVAALFAAVATGEPITDPFPEPVEKADFRIDLELVADDGLVSPVWGTHAGDGSGRFFVADQAGFVWLIHNGELQEEPYLDATDYLVPLQEGFDERGLIGLAFHPDFANEGEAGYGKLYTHTSEPVAEHAPAEFEIDMPEDLPPNHIGVISEWQVRDHAANRVDSGERRVVTTFDQPQFNHNGGIIVFGPDNMLYITLGDGGGANDIGAGHTPEIGNSQDTSNVLGTILRIDPLGEAGPTPDHGRYAIPADNPFLDDDDVLDVIYAYGLRNVFLMSFDGDDLIAADVGQEHIEIVNIIEAGGNYGWNYMEGSFYFDPTAERGLNIRDEPLPDRPVPDGLLMPVIEYDHDEGTCIMGGFVYRGGTVDVLEGLYVFGDWRRQDMPDGRDASGRLFVGDLESGEMWALPVGEAGDSHTGDLITGFGEDEEGEIYVLTNDTAGPAGTNGRVWKIVPYQD